MAVIETDLRTQTTYLGTFPSSRSRSRAMRLSLAAALNGCKAILGDWAAQSAAVRSDPSLRVYAIPNGSASSISD